MLEVTDPGDTILLRAGETFTGNVVLRAKGALPWPNPENADAFNAALVAAERSAQPTAVPGLPLWVRSVCL